MISKEIPSGTPARSQHEIGDAGKRFGKHVIAIALGFIMTVAGLGMGVTLVLLPIGIPVAVVGILMFIWGLVDWNKTRP